MAIRYYFRFREQDGDWSPWNLCSRADYERYNGMTDCQVKMEQAA